MSEIPERYRKTAEQKAEQKRLAQECSDKVVASGHMCAGCYFDSMCDINKKFNKMRGGA